MDLDSVLIGTSENNASIIRNLKNEQTVNGEIKFDKSLTSDGSYILKVFAKEKSYGNLNLLDIIPMVDL